jgi:hypothetical protein
MIGGRAVPVEYVDGDLHLLLAAEIIAEWSDEDRLNVLKTFEDNSDDLRCIEALSEASGYNNSGYVGRVQKIAEGDGPCSDHAKTVLSEHWVEVGRRRRLEQQRTKEKISPSPKAYARPGGYVYLIQGGEHYKIGVSTRLSRRLSELGTLPPFDLVLIHSVWLRDPTSLERKLHAMWESQHARGEWFLLSDEDVTFTKTVMDSVAGSEAS